jgi:hypothetical protein
MNLVTYVSFVKCFFFEKEICSLQKIMKCMKMLNLQSIA